MHRSPPITNAISRLSYQISPKQRTTDRELGTNLREHVDLQRCKAAYFFEAASTPGVYTAPSDPRLVAFYLPQFHPTEENDAAWGPGFTEWTNVATAKPRFVGQDQPLVPRDLGFYDLRIEATMLEQVRIARHHGLHGFAFYYYWFSGRQLLDLPLSNFLNHPEWDLNFCICWANENWTRRWDGRDSDVIVAQRYRREDALAFIARLERVLLDPRYIRYNGRPLLIVYRASEIPDIEAWAETWRNYMRTENGEELHLASVLSFDAKDPRAYGFDSAVDFPPLTLKFKRDLFPGHRVPQIGAPRLLDPEFSGAVMDYRELYPTDRLESPFQFHTFKCVMPSWDNEPRRKGQGVAFCNSDPDGFAVWLDRVIARERTKETSPIVFLNSWNEWGESAALEPSMQYGRAYLNRLSEVLAAHSSSRTNATHVPPFGIRRRAGADLAVVVHLYYPDRWAPIQEALKFLPVHCRDIFVTLPPEHMAFGAKLVKEMDGLHAISVPNRGRDILPFLHLARRLTAAGYESVLKLHSKSSPHLVAGDQWFADLLSDLIPGSEAVHTILTALAEQPTIVGPREHYLSLERFIGSNQTDLLHLLGRLTSPLDARRLLLQRSLGFFAGSMFWASARLLEPLLTLHLLSEDFQLEDGSLDGTMAHAVERLFGLLPRLVPNGRTYLLDGGTVSAATRADLVTRYAYTKPRRRMATRR